MAWYRAGGGGIPSSLKTDMNDVLNKKFGTSTTYPTEDWPDTVNLMGPLPEKTVSGAIATFADGADAVPLKKCEITLPASLDGYDSVDVVAAGKNVFEMDNINQISLYSNLASGYWYTDKIVLPANTTFTISPSSTAALGVGDYFLLYINPDASDPDYLVITNPSIKYVVNAGNPVTITFTTGATGVIRFGIASYAAQPKQSAFDAFLSINYQIEVGSTASTFEPYSGTTHTASLGRTIYGGTADVVNGSGEDSYKIITVGNSGWNYYASGGYIYKDFNDKVTPTIGDADHVLVTDNPDMPYGGVNYASQFQDLHVYQAQNKAIYIKDTSCTSVSDFYTKYSDMQIGYELATPETFTFDPVPIDSKLGNNTIWSDSGDMEVTYRADINLALGGI